MSQTPTSAHCSHSSVTLRSGSHWLLVEHPLYPRAQCFIRQSVSFFKGPNNYKVPYIVLKTAALALISGIAWDKSGYLITACCSPSVYLHSDPHFFTVLSPSLWVGNSPLVLWDGEAWSRVLFCSCQPGHVSSHGSLITLIYNSQPPEILKGAFM